ncbi:uncharacterized protein LOC106007897 isoform X1 [Heterocephalus glaber]|uniref:Uncharacterized protein LOC106007897 isoform X1 n=1 Tax=Heterocephalus glaber TaxID=10181 RepID=A0AAX6RVE4_HETGA|nr:uncharacterized protein LOC106007897 isoform X1 [Heterocephalus glaber]
MPRPCPEGRVGTKAETTPGLGTWGWRFSVPPRFPIGLNTASAQEPEDWVTGGPGPSCSLHFSWAQAAERLLPVLPSEAGPHEPPRLAERQQRAAAQPLAQVTHLAEAIWREVSQDLEPQMKGRGHCLRCAGQWQGTAALPPFWRASAFSGQSLPGPLGGERGGTGVWGSGTPAPSSLRALRWPGRFWGRSLEQFSRWLPHLSLSSSARGRGRGGAPPCFQAPALLVWPGGGALLLGKSAGWGLRLFGVRSSSGATLL